MKTLAFISATLLTATLLCAQSTPHAAPAQNKAKSTTTKVTHKHKKVTHKKSDAKRSSRRIAKQEPVTPAPVIPQPPPPPPTLAQQAPVAPRVTFQNGLLSIDAPNSTLGDILGGIRRATGATIDGPTAVNDRVVVHLGPGQPRDVMNSLLSSSRFNFVVMGTPQQPNGLSRIVLLARQGAAEPPPTSAGNTPVVRPTPPPPQQQAINNDSDEEDTPERDDNGDQPPSSPPTAVQPEGQYTGQPQNRMPPDQNAPQSQGDPNQANQAAPKTPEQLYKELQDLERQRLQPQGQQQNQQQPNQPTQDQDQQPR